MPVTRMLMQADKEGFTENPRYRLARLVARHERKSLGDFLKFCEESLS